MPAVHQTAELEHEKEHRGRQRSAVVEVDAHQLVRI